MQTRTLCAHVAWTLMTAIAVLPVSTALAHDEGVRMPVQVEEVDEARLVRVTEVIAAPIDAVWANWSTGDGFEAFLGVPAAIEPRVGGRFEVQFLPDAPDGQRGSEGCRVLSTIPGRMISFTWNAPPSFPAVRGGGRHTVVVVELSQVGQSHTQVTLTHHGWPRVGAQLPDIQEWNGCFEYFGKAWPSVIAELKKHHAEKPGAAGAIDPKSGWVYLITLSDPGMLTSATPEQQAKFKAHAEYIHQLTRAGTVLVAGPVTDMKAPGIVIYQAPDEAAAKSIMENDPAVQAGLFKAEYHPMRLSFVRGRE